MNRINSHYLRKLHAEISIMKQVDHPNVIKVPWPAWKCHLWSRRPSHPGTLTLSFPNVIKVRHGMAWHDMAWHTCQWTCLEAPRLLTSRHTNPPAPSSSATSFSARARCTW